jgi:Flp pilus assembly protein TadG
MLQLHLSGKTSTLRKTWATPRSWAGKFAARFHEERGQSTVEFALLFPLLAAVLIGMIQFGIVFWNQITLTNAANNAAQAIMSGPGVITDPCSTANTAFYQSAPSLNNSKVYGTNPLTFSITAYTSTSASTSSTGNKVVFATTGGPSCTSLASSLTQGQEVVVTATYGCNLQLFGFNPAPNCKLTAQTAEAVQ